MSEISTPDPTDPVLVRRARIDKAASLGRRVGYLLFLAALVIFLIGFFGRFATWVSTMIVACLIVGSILLIPSIVFGYAVKAADRHDQGLPDGH